MKILKILLILLILFSFAVYGCGDDDEEEIAPTPTPTVVPSPTPIPTPPVEPSPTPIPNGIELVRQYGVSDEVAVRWGGDTVLYRDKSNWLHLEEVLNEWREVLYPMGVQLKEGGDFAPLSIEFSREMFTGGNWGAVGLCFLHHVDARIVRARIVIREPGNYNIFGQTFPWFPTAEELYEVFSHELCHALGFWGHTDEGGLMDPYRNDSSEITPTIRLMLSTLYSMEPGERLVEGATIPREGFFVIDDQL